MKLNIFNTPVEVLHSLADYFIAIGNKSINKKGKFTIALSGGSPPKKLYELLASEFYRNKLDWNKTYFFFGDERCVPHTDINNNYLMAKNSMFNALQIHSSNVFAVNTVVEPKAAAEQYNQTIKAFFEGSEVRFDLVLLGLGNDAHTASLFPHTDVLKDTVPAVKEVWLPKQEVYRITLNAPLINLANHIAFLVYGESKSDAVHHALKGESNPEEYPAQLIRKDDVEWFLDNAAAAMVIHNKSISFIE